MATRLLTLCVILPFVSLAQNYPSKVQYSVLTEWIRKYESTVSDSSETKSGLIELNDLRNLLKYIDDENMLRSSNKIDGIRVYFIRPTNDGIHDRHILPLKNKNAKGEAIGQMSIAIVRTYGYKENFKNTNHAGAYNYTEGTGTMQMIYVVHPGGNEHSGLCPPNCGH